MKVRRAYELMEKIKTLLMVILLLVSAGAHQNRIIIDMTELFENKTLLNRMGSKEKKLS